MWTTRVVGCPASPGCAPKLEDEPQNPELIAHSPGHGLNLFQRHRDPCSEGA